MFGLNVFRQADAPHSDSVFRSFSSGFRHVRRVIPAICSTLLLFRLSGHEAYLLRRGLRSDCWTLLNRMQAQGTMYASSSALNSSYEPNVRPPWNSSLRCPNTCLVTALSRQLPLRPIDWHMPRHSSLPRYPPMLVLPSHVGVRDRDRARGQALREHRDQLLLLPEVGAAVDVR